MKWSNSKTVLAVLVLILGALVLLRYVHFSAYSVEDIGKELSVLCGEYAEHCGRSAKEPEWEALQQRMQETTEPIIADIDKHGSMRRVGEWHLYQLARYHLPKAIASRGKIPAEDLTQWLAVSEKQTKEVQRSSEREERRRRRAAREEKVGPLVTGLAVFDFLLLIGIGYAFFWPKRTHSYVPKDKESALRQLDEKIRRNPESLRYRAVRARLLAEAGRHEDAIVDIDWILDRQPQGVDLDEWHRLREVAAQGATAKD